MYLIIFGLYSLSRLFHLMALPLFMDEALYIHWIHSNQPLISLTEDGQPPLFFILASALKNLFHVADTLMLIRIFSVIMGGLALWYGIHLTKTLTSNKTAPFGFALLYISSPFMRMYDRLGMRESTITAVFFATFYYLLNGQLWLAGIAMALGILTKSTAWFIPLMVLVYLLSQKKALSFRKIVKLFGPILCVLLISISTNSFGAVVTKNQIFVTAPGELLSHVRNNAYQTALWLWQYLSWPICLGFMLVLTKKNHRGLILAILIPIFIEIVIAKIYFPRYFLISAAGILLILSVKIPKLPIVIAMCLLGLFTAKLPQIEKWQYIYGWPSGTGVKETAQFIASYQPDYIVTEPTELLHTGLVYYQPSLADKMIRPINPTRAIMALHLGKNLPSGYNGVKLFEYHKPEGEDSIVVYNLEVAP